MSSRHRKYGVHGISCPRGFTGLRQGMMDEEVIRQFGRVNALGADLWTELVDCPRKGARKRIRKQMQSIGLTRYQGVLVADILIRHFKSEVGQSNKPQPTHQKTKQLRLLGDG